MAVFEERVVLRQARLIDELRTNIQALHRKIDEAHAEADQLRAAAHYYNMIQKACMESPVVAGEFQRFLMTCRLVDESEDGVPGLTTSLSSDQYGLDF